LPLRRSSTVVFMECLVISFINGLLVLAAASLIERAVDQNLRENCDLTQAQFEILAHLQQAGQGMRMTDLAQGLILSRSGATYQIQQLAAAGYVTREADPADDRGITVHLTRRGADALSAALPGHYAVVQHVMFDAISDGQAERLAAILEAIVQRAGQPVPALAPSYGEQGDPAAGERS
jgi:DNA-binding MarR family transcriptional regulator